MSTPVNTGAVSAMGSQFNTNVFSGISSRAARTSRKLQRQAAKQGNTSPAAPTSNAGGTPMSATTLPPDAATTGRARRQARAQAGAAPTPPPPTYSTSPTPHAPGAGGPAVTGINVMQGRANRQARAQAAKVQPNAVPFSHTATAPKVTAPAPQRFGGAVPMSHPQTAATPINRTAFNQPSTTPFSAPQSNVSSPSQFKTAPKPSTTPFSVGPITPSPTPSTTSPQASTNPFANKSNANAPAQASQQQLSSQFANTKQGSNAPFPTHQHPSGSSNMILQNASKALSEPGRPNTVIVGSRNASPGGIAAAGSRLEAWAQAKSSAVQARRASQQAGGRDKGLAQQATAAENLANQPLNRFAP